jgi:hypothetical protein
LLDQAGYGSFRDARGPLRLTQRQGSGKFTRAEAEALIEQLSTDSEAGEPAAPPAAPAARTRRTTPAAQPRAVPSSGEPPSKGGTKLRDIPAEVLADELVRRGWAVIAP